jgi:hypothetical protein
VAAALLIIAALGTIVFWVTPNREQQVSFRVQAKAGLIEDQLPRIMESRGFQMRGDMRWEDGRKVVVVRQIKAVEAEVDLTEVELRLVNCSELGEMIIEDLMKLYR